MAQLNRPLLFTAEADVPVPVDDEILPRAVRPSVMRALWAGLLVVLVLLTLVMLAWRAG